MASLAAYIKVCLGKMSVAAHQSAVQQLHVYVMNQMMGECEDFAIKVL
jgi:hypothetical protein